MSKVNITMPQETIAPVETVKEAVSCIGLLRVKKSIPTKLSQLEDDLDISSSVGDVSMALEALVETGIINPAADTNNALYVNKAGAIYVL